MPDFVLANIEFKRQATILDSLIETIDVSASQDGVTPYEIAGNTLPIVPTGGQNTMAAAAVVLLAAHFEEYVRQQIEEYAKAVVIEYEHLDEGFRDKLIDNYWRSGTAKLTAIRPKGSLTWASEAGTLLRGMVEYPVSGNTQEFRPDYLCIHENNMRWATIVELSARVGVRSLGELMNKTRKLKDILGAARNGQFKSAIERKMNSFYEMRNGIVHSISQNSGIGASIFKEWSGFFRVFAEAFSDSLDASFAEFSKSIEKRKNGAR